MKTFDYCFQYADGHTDRVSVVLDTDRYQPVMPDSFSPPPWARLDQRQCTDCPLADSGATFCPVAHGLAFYMQPLSARDSHEPVTVTVVTDERSYQARTTVQRALASLLGLIMAVSACPKTRFLKPMGIFHLPFSSPEETLARAAACHLLALHLHSDGHRDTATGMASLAAHYQDLRQVNRALVRVLNSCQRHDAPVNALVLLDLLAAEIPQEIDDRLARLKPLFVG